jgi:hypothetical protein
MVLVALVVGTFSKRQPVSATLEDGRALTKKTKNESSFACLDDSPEETLTTATFLKDSMRVVLSSHFLLLATVH